MVAFRSYPCKGRMEQLMALDEHTLSSEERQDLEAHLKTCRRCREATAAHVQTTQLLQRLPRYELTYNLPPQLLKQWAAEDRRQQRKGSTIPLSQARQWATLAGKTSFKDTTQPLPPRPRIQVGVNVWFDDATAALDKAGVFLPLSPGEVPVLRILTANHLHWMTAREIAHMVADQQGRRLVSEQHVRNIIIKLRAEGMDIRHSNKGYRLVLEGNQGS